MAMQLQQTKHSTPPRILLHGTPKVGKSTFASQLPNPIFLPTEDGLNGIDAKALVEEGKSRIESFDEFNAALSFLEQNPDAYESVVIDSLDWLERLIWQKVCDDHSVKTIELAAGGYGKGYGEALLHWQNIVRRLDAINKRGKIIMCICHSKAIAFNDPMSEPYDIWEIKLHASKQGQGALTLFKEWVDVIGFAAIEKFVGKAEGSTKIRATETGKRVVHVNGTAAFLAGNRYSMPSPIDLNWESFKTALLQPQ